jgi:phosphate transport system substrate-binding protein
LNLNNIAKIMRKKVSRRTKIGAIALCAALVTPLLYAEEQLPGNLVIEGTGDSQALLREIAECFEKYYPETTIQVPESIGSSGGIKAVRAGDAELGRVARMLKAEESGNVTYTAFAMSPVVLVVHPSVKGVNNFTAEQIVDIYSGTITSWQQLGGPAHKVYPIGREAGDSSRLILEAYIPGFQEIRNLAAKVYYTTPDAMQAIIEHEYTVGYVPRAMIDDNSVRIMNIDGIAPSLKNIRQNRYTMVTPLGIVYKEPLSVLAKTFVDFLYTPEAQRIIEKYGCLPTEKVPMGSD